MVRIWVLRSRAESAGTRSLRAKRSVLLGLGLAAVVSSAALGAGKLPDLVVSQLANPPASIGKRFAASARIANIGNAHAGASPALFYLSHDKLLGPRDVLVGSPNVGGIDAGKHTTIKPTLVVPNGTAPGKYFLIACADGTDPPKITESSYKNNCRASQKSGKVPCFAGDTDCDGWRGPADCKPRNPAIHPGAPDKPDLKFVDSNCDGIDGNARRAVFVSATTGDDAAPGTRAQPKQTFRAAIGTATSERKDVYAALGTYAETLFVGNAVSVYGGYDTSWKRSLSNETLVTGNYNGRQGIEAAAAQDVTTPTTVQLLTLAPHQANFFDFSTTSYGLRGLNDPGLRLVHLKVQAAFGRSGLYARDGVPGQDGGGGTSGKSGGLDGPARGAGGAAGTSPGSHVGGRGGNGRASDPGGGSGGSGQDGAQGLATHPDRCGQMGGAAGLGGAGGSAFKPGGSGQPGGPGCSGGNGAGGGSGNSMALGKGVWIGDSGGAGANGIDGHGGGGGGGGGADSACGSIFCDSNVGGGGGGGGGGGQGGGGGGGGAPGGGSFGIFLVDSAGAIVRNSVVSASNGGDGGGGAGGAHGGAGGPIGFGGASRNDAGHGGAGGPGGDGGAGGDGGGGAGGPSVAIYGLSSADAPGTTVSHGSPGAGGPGGNGTGLGAPAGAAGVAADFLLGS